MNRGAPEQAQLVYDGREFLGTIRPLGHRRHRASDANGHNLGTFTTVPEAREAVLVARKASQRAESFPCP